MVLCLVGVGAESPERLAKRECSKCHAFPPPGSMHREDWEKGAFPYLEDLLGIDQIENYDAQTQAAVRARWDAIKSYYLKQSHENPQPIDAFPLNRVVAVAPQSPWEPRPDTLQVKSSLLSSETAKPTFRWTLRFGNLF